MDFYQVLCFLILRDVEPATGFTAKEGRCVSKVACIVPEVEGDQENQEDQEDEANPEVEVIVDDEENDDTTEKEVEGDQENQDYQENKADPEVENDDVTTEKAAATTAKSIVN